MELHVVPKAAQAAELSTEQLDDARRYAASLTAPQEPANTFEVPGDSMARYRLWKRLDRRATAGEELEAGAARWHRDYHTTPEFRSIQEMYEFAEAEQARA
ncbi:hypothetical protein D3C78_1402450 [compost metagenome]